MTKRQLRQIYNNEEIYKIDDAIQVSEEQKKSNKQRVPYFAYVSA